jgi:hypothetical protein
MTREIIQELKVIGSFNITEGSRTRVRVIQAGDNVFVDIRKFYLGKTRDLEPEWKPTANGISIPIDDMPKLKRAINATEKWIDGQ